MSEFDTRLTPAQSELLDMLQEEAAEVIQAVAKIKRHGFMSFNPNDLHKVTNMAHLSQELGDLLGVMAALDGKGAIDRDAVQYYASNKMDRAAPFLHHQN